jgi:copper chaperone NosL
MQRTVFPGPIVSPRDSGRNAWTRALLVGALLALAHPAPAAEALRVPAPTPTDTCQVCGMFVTKYPEWIATVVYRDGVAAHFDGPKDLFKYLFDLRRYAPGRQREDVTLLAVTEYYGLARIDARSAWFVIGSDVLGPMGHELIPLASIEEAQEFLADHRGRAVLRFEDVTPQVIEGLDGGQPAPRR